MSQIKKSIINLTELYLSDSLNITLSFDLNKVYDNIPIQNISLTYNMKEYWHRK